MKNEVRDSVEKLLDAAGIAHRFVPSGRHAKVLFEHNGRPEFVVVPNSPSCRRAAANARSFVRRLLRAGAVP